MVYLFGLRTRMFSTRRFEKHLAQVFDVSLHSRKSEFFQHAVGIHLRGLWQRIAYVPVSSDRVQKRVQKGRRVSSGPVCLTALIILCAVSFSSFPIYPIIVRSKSVLAMIVCEGHAKGHPAHHRNAVWVNPPSG